MSLSTASILAMFGLTEQEHARGWKAVEVSMADGTPETVTLCRFATQEQNALALRDYAIEPDARYLLAQMIIGGAAPTFFDSLAIGEMDRLNNLALALLTALESLPQYVTAGHSSISVSELSAILIAAARKCREENAAREGGFHG